MKLKLFTASAMALALVAGVAGCTKAELPPRELSEETTALFANVPAGTGYFATDSTLPFQTPDFSKISDEDYEPAFTEAREIHKAEIAAIKNNPAEPTFDNTIVAMEISGAMLSRVATVFFALTGANTNDTLDAVNEKNWAWLNVYKIPKTIGKHSAIKVSTANVKGLITGATLQNDNFMLCGYNTNLVPFLIYISFNRAPGDNIFSSGFAKESLENELQDYMASVYIQATEKLFNGVELIVGDFHERSRREYGPSKMLYQERKIIIEPIINT